MSLVELIPLGVGGALAAVLRFFLTTPLETFPWRTLFVNTLGSLAMGFVLAWAEPHGILRAVLVSGFCGAFTTFSAFAWQATVLAGRGRIMAALGYVVLTAALPVLAVWVGLFWARSA